MDPAVKALMLLDDVVPRDARRGSDDVIAVRGNVTENVYIISPYTQTVRYKGDNKYAHYCLQLSVACPNYDRMIAEYILITRDEMQYLRTANEFLHHIRVINRAIDVAWKVFLTTLGGALMLLLLKYVIK